MSSKSYLFWLFVSQIFQLSFPILFGIAALLGAGSAKPTSNMDGLEIGLFFVFFFPLITFYAGIAVLFIASWRRMAALHLSLLWLFPLAVWLLMTPTNFVGSVWSSLVGWGMPMMAYRPPLQALIGQFGIALQWAVFVALMTRSETRPRWRRLEMAAWLLAIVGAVCSLGFLSFNVRGLHQFFPEVQEPLGALWRYMLSLRRAYPMLFDITGVLYKVGFPLALLTIVLIRRFGSNPAPAGPKEDAWHKRLDDIPPTDEVSTTD